MATVQASTTVPTSTPSAARKPRYANGNSANCHEAVTTRHTNRYKTVTAHFSSRVTKAGDFMGVAGTFTGKDGHSPALTHLEGLEGAAVAPPPAPLHTATPPPSVRQTDATQRTCRQSLANHRHGEETATDADIGEGASTGSSRGVDLHAELGRDLLERPT
jgi:hypothetical protein